MVALSKIRWSLGEKKILTVIIDQSSELMFFENLQKIPWGVVASASKRQNFHLPNLMQMNSNKGFYSFTSDLSHEKFDWTRKKAEFPLVKNCCLCDFSIVSIKYFPLQSTWTDRSCEDKWKKSRGRHITSMKKITFSQLSWKRKTNRSTLFSRKQLVRHKMHITKRDQYWISKHQEVYTIGGLSLHWLFS